MATIGTLIAMACLWFSHYVLDLTSPLADNIAANGIGLVLAMTFRFWAYRRLVFKGHLPDDEPGDDPDKDLANAEDGVEWPAAAKVGASRDLSDPA